MHIGIDARLYAQTGVGRYLRSLLDGLKHVESSHTFSVYLRDEEYDLFDIPHRRWKKHRLNIPWHSLKEQILLPGIFSSGGHDVMHFPYFTIPIGYRGKYLLTIHDLIIDHVDTGRASTLPLPLYKLKRFGYRWAMKYGVSHASHITVISETTKQELLDHYHPDPKNVTVTYDALDEHFFDVVKHHTPTRRISDPYILYVGNAYPHKNLERLLRAYKRIISKHPIKLVLAGNDGFFYPRLEQEAHRLGLSDHIQFFGMANDTQLVDLYTYAEIVVFPSLMEGFGLPTFEALACDVLPVLSDIPVFRELWGDDLVYFSPSDETDMTESILSVLMMPRPEYKRLVSKAKPRIYTYSWDTTVSKTLEIYEGIGNL